MAIFIIFNFRKILCLIFLISLPSYAQNEKPRDRGQSEAKKRLSNKRINRLMSSIKKLFDDEVIEYKEKLGLVSTLSDEDKFIYRFIINHIHYSEMGDLSQNGLKEFLVQQKYALLKKENRLYELLKNGDDLDALKNKNKLDLNIDPVNTLSDIGWEWATVIDHPTIKSILSRSMAPGQVQAHNSAAATKGTVGTQGASQQTSPFPMSAVLNMAASGLGIGISLLQGTQLFFKEQSLKKLKVTKTQLELMNSELEKSIETAPETEKSFLVLEQFEKQQRLIQVEKNLDPKNKTIEQLRESLIYNVLLSSSWFSSATLGLLPEAGTSVAIGVSGAAVGGIFYGGLLGYMGFKGLWDGRQRLPEINKEIVDAQSSLAMLLDTTLPPSEFIPQIQSFFHLKLSYLKKVKRNLELWDKAKNTLTLGLGTSTSVGGALGTAATLGAVGVTSTALIANGYGAIALLGGTIICGGVVLQKKYHYLDKLMEGLRRSLDKNKLENRDSLPARIYTARIRKKIDQKLKKYVEALQKIDQLSIEHTQLLKNSNNSLELSQNYVLMMEKAKEIINLLSEIEQLNLQRAPIKLLKELPSVKLKKSAWSLLQSLDRLDGEQLINLSKEFNFPHEILENFPEEQKKREYLKAWISFDIIGSPLTTD